MEFYKNDINLKLKSSYNMIDTDVNNEITEVLFNMIKSFDDVKQNDIDKIDFFRDLIDIINKNSEAINSHVFLVNDFEMEIYQMFMEPTFGLSEILLKVLSLITMYKLVCDIYIQETKLFDLCIGMLGNVGNLNTINLVFKIMINLIPSFIEKNDINFLPFETVRSTSLPYNILKFITTTLLYDDESFDHILKYIDIVNEVLEKIDLQDEDNVYELFKFLYLSVHSNISNAFYIFNEQNNDEDHFYSSPLFDLIYEHYNDFKSNDTITIYLLSFCIDILKSSQKSSKFILSKNINVDLLLDIIKNNQNSDIIWRALSTLKYLIYNSTRESNTKETEYDNIIPNSFYCLENLEYFCNLLNDSPYNLCIIIIIIIFNFVYEGDNSFILYLIDINFISNLYTFYLSEPFKVSFFILFILEKSKQLYPKRVQLIANQILNLGIIEESKELNDEDLKLVIHKIKQLIEEILN